MDTHTTKEKIKQKIDEIFLKIEELESRGKEFAEDAQSEYKEQISALKEEKAHLEEKYHAFRADSEIKMNEAKVTSQSAWQDFKNGFKKLFGIFK